MRAKVAASNRHQEQHERLVERIQQLMTIDNEHGLVVKVALLSGLSRKEMVYAFCEEVCDNPSCIGCKKLHVINKRNGMSIIAINWIQSGKRCYFTMLPTILWQQFRGLPAFNECNIKAADKITNKSARIKFSVIRSIFYQVMSDTMNSEQLGILIGSASHSAARNYLILAIDDMIRSYILAWERAGLILPVL
jgi:hypothetical protein